MLQTIWFGKDKRVGEGAAARGSRAYTTVLIHHLEKCLPGEATLAAEDVGGTTGRRLWWGCCSEGKLELDPHFIKL